MRLLLLIIPLVFLLLVQNTFAGEVRVIELTDGSTITGEVLSLSNGVYTIKSESLGTIKLAESKIRAIRAKSSGTDAASPKDTSALQEKMVSDKEIMGLIQSLQNDPDFKKALEDPEIMKAVNDGDIAALTANPRFMKLLNNATVREIQQKAR
ncbi:MAG TPA: hypothetical protein VEI57_05245 [Nitrospirota bacterium]|nr:hypothetical protein [Nitrospirota bacterium]